MRTGCRHRSWCADQPTGIATGHRLTDIGNLSEACSLTDVIAFEASCIAIWSLARSETCRVNAERLRAVSAQRPGAFHLANVCSNALLFFRPTKHKCFDFTPHMRHPGSDLAELGSHSVDLRLLQEQETGANRRRRGGGCPREASCGARQDSPCSVFSHGGCKLC